MKKGLKQSKGITLIALVITIIMLIIVAGVTIAMLTGENGIPGRATETRSTNAEGQADELQGAGETTVKLKKDNEDMATGGNSGSGSGGGNTPTSTVEFPNGQDEGADVTIGE